MRDRQTIFDLSLPKTFTTSKKIFKRSKKSEEKQRWQWHQRRNRKWMNSKVNQIFFFKKTKKKPTNLLNKLKHLLLYLSLPVFLSLSFCLYFSLSLSLLLVEFYYTTIFTPLSNILERIFRTKTTDKKKTKKPNSLR